MNGTGKDPSFLLRNPPEQLPDKYSHLEQVNRSIKVFGHFGSRRNHMPVSDSRTQSDQPEDLVLSLCRDFCEQNRLPGFGLEKRIIGIAQRCFTYSQMQGNA